MIKKIFSVLIIALLFGLPSSLFAQANPPANSCVTVGSGNYSQCCGLGVTVDNPSYVAAECTNYEKLSQVFCRDISSNDMYNICCSVSRIRDKNQNSCVAYEAKITTSCSVVNDSNFRTCCPNLTSYSAACMLYLSPPLGGGTQNTNPQNGGSGAVSGTIGTTPQSNAAALKTCSAIRFDSLLDILIWLKCIIGAAIIPLIFAIAFILFLRGVLMFMYKSDNKEKKDESKKLMFYGVIGLVVMVSVWGIVNIINTTFGFGNTVPQLQTDCLTTDKNNPCKK